MKKIIFVALATVFLSAAWAKIPAPVLDDAGKAKAEEAKAKTAWAGKVDAYQLCKAQDKVAVHVNKGARPKGKDAAPVAVVATAPCADPGPFVSTLPGATPATTPASSAKAAKADKPAKKS
ncbi:MAG: hypothetical protein KAY82_04010 [Hylemonella sp.]|nr:hypothetical protein [Hylemonella sp.]